MFYKLSNTAPLAELEDIFGVRHHFPNIYEPKKIINGLNEENLTVILSDNTSTLNVAIWGILPEDYVDDWEMFQNISNTLNVHTETLHTNRWYSDALYQRRCLVIVTGYFTTLLNNGKVYPYYVYRRNRKPFCLAGIYNRLRDGFITASIIISKDPFKSENLNNLHLHGPVILGEDDSSKWIDPYLTENDVHELIDFPGYFDLQAHPIAKEFYKNDIIFSGILDPVKYKNIPTSAPN